MSDRPSRWEDDVNDCCRLVSNQEYIGCIEGSATSSSGNWQLYRCNACDKLFRRLGYYAEGHNVRYDALLPGHLVSCKGVRFDRWENQLLWDFFKKLVRTTFAVTKMRELTEEMLGVTSREENVTEEVEVRSG